MLHIEKRLFFPPHLKWLMSCGLFWRFQPLDNNTILPKKLISSLLKHIPNYLKS